MWLLLIHVGKMLEDAETWILKIFACRLNRENCFNQSGHVLGITCIRIGYNHI